MVNNRRVKGYTRFVELCVRAKCTAYMFLIRITSAVELNLSVRCPFVRLHVLMNAVSSTYRGFKLIDRFKHLYFLKVDAWQDGCFKDFFICIFRKSKHL